MSVVREFYPDSYDVTVKMRSKLFASISPILELVRQREYVSAAEIMVLVTEKIVNSEYYCYVVISMHFTMRFNNGSQAAR